MSLTRPDVLPVWAESGDIVQPSNAEIQTGWPLSNTPPSRQRFNWLLKYLMNGVRFLTRRGVPDYSASEAYEVGDRVLASDGNTYRCIQAGTNKSPLTETAYWERWGYSASDLTNILNQQDYKSSVRVASTANIETLSGLIEIDGVTPIAGDRVLVKDQTTPSQNGIWVAAVGAWARASDADAGAEFNAGAIVPVEEGTTQADTLWQMTTNGTPTIGVSSLAFVQVSGGSIGTPGTYASVTTDAKGRVIAGSTTQAWSTITGTPTTLAGYGITDGNFDPTARDQIALTNLRLELATSVGTGALLAGKQWELATDEWGATSTNEAYVSNTPSYYVVSPNLLSPTNMTSDTSPSPYVSASSNAYGPQPAWKLFDGNSSSNALNNGGAPSWWSIDLGTAYTAVKYEFQCSANARNPSGWIFQGSNDNANWVDLDTRTSQAQDGNVKEFTFSNSTSYRYYRLYATAGGDGSYIGEIIYLKIFGGPLAQMTLIPPASVSLAAAPSYADALFLWKDDSGTAVLGTDLTVELSRDNGTTWTTATLTNMLGTAGYDGTYSIIKARANLSTQPSGTSLTCRIKTLNNKAQRVAAPALYAE